MSDTEYPDEGDYPQGTDAFEDATEYTAGEIEQAAGGELAGAELGASEAGTGEWWPSVVDCCLPQDDPAAAQEGVAWVDPTGATQLLPASDTNGDGVPDTGMIDRSGDGYYDAWVVDSTGTGTADTMLLDQDGDGYADAVSYDPNGTGQWTEPMPYRQPAAQPVWEQPADPGSVITVGGTPIPGTEAADPAGVVTAGGTPVPGTEAADPPGVMIVGGTPIPGITEPAASGPGDVTVVGGEPFVMPESPDWNTVIPQLVEAGERSGDPAVKAQIQEIIHNIIDTAGVWTQPSP